MKVEIWSDVACPFCYIGKKRFEKGLANFEHNKEIEIEWKSFQLDPTLPEEGAMKLPDYMARQKGLSQTEVKAMFQHVIQMADSEGIEMKMEQINAANTLTMHRLIQLAKTKGLGEIAEEEFFKAYFSGKDFTNIAILLEICETIGLNNAEAKEVIESEKFSDHVSKDIYDARTIGVRGVPHFVFNDKYTVSGAQSSETFLGALEKSYKEWKQNNNA
ncbi:DsbA family oxidoreductase [Albibacterium bauzanense]|uniref:Putative DsbA family dithiol-disulfide isomerase n=1 Tax=Albibacterium bauzanense TaxID=653929 RepID=A0A4R1M183_9SPHI|nr:DsbA family oxidoreductase [Albibacterium bauzanense]TCK85706.1 putative DsbA family dithiol-disulfide isomerase [Albibacterium bauzanense]